MDLCDLRAIQALLERHGFRFSKSMGQNFLIDESIPRDIAASSQADKGCGVLEIGPGIGPLTAQLAQRAGKVVSIELDKTLLPVLEETLGDYDNVEIISADVMKLDLNALIQEKFQGLTPIVCANLPYNITTPVMTKLMETEALQSITVLVQKEAARRLTSVTKDVGPLYWELQYRMETEYLFDVPADRFYPQPKVTSAVMRCLRRETPAVEVEDEKFFLKVIHGAFLLRRKTLVNSLSAAFPRLEKTAILSAIERCGLPPTVRGEALDLNDFAALARAMKG
ncbi:MAG: ribosomal RNA small subunit methyltransferase A [Oscillibacter sp.]|nr:ribosomal RNA small subunit methyltransferase A [Oscillibacter sp.]